eukprot:Em0010g273a
MVSRQAVLDECATFFPELLPWVSWCYGTHPLLWHPLGRISSESGVQQGDPLGPLLFALVLQKLVSSLDADDECAEILLQAWYREDGALVGTRPAVLRALHLTEELGPALGLHVNLAKCELFSRRGNTYFPPEVRYSLLPNLDILGAPIGDYLHCSKIITGRCAEPRRLLSGLVDVAAVDLQVAVTLLCMCGSFCRMVHIARVTPPSLASDALSSFDEEVKQCFTMCSAINVTNDAWSQAQLGPKFGQAVINTQVSLSNTISVNSVQDPTIPQKVLSGMIQAHFHILLESSSPANRAHLLSVAAPHVSSWLSVVPSPGLGLHLESNEYQMAIRWWLGLDTYGPLTSLLLAGTEALDLTITSPLCSAILSESCHQASAAALAAEVRKLHSNGPKCQELGWSCILLAVETYGNWDKLATSRYLAPLAETLALMSHGALLFGDGHLDGWTMWTGDKANIEVDFGSGPKRKEFPLRIKATREELEEASDHFNTNPVHRGGCKIGEREFGSVYKGILKHTEVAIKVLLNSAAIPKDERGQELVAQYLDTELRVLTKYRHPNLVVLLGYHSSPSLKALVYECLPNGTLEDALQTGLQCHAREAGINTGVYLPWMSRISIATDTARGLVYLHTADKEPLVHRNVKSASILLDMSFRAKLSDFGQACALKEDGSTQAQTVMETSGYFPPEYYRGEITTRMDTYSFGVVLLEVLTGLRAYDSRRSPKHLVTYMERDLDKGNGSILCTKIDCTSGNWPSESFMELFVIAHQCLNSKMYARPEMAEVSGRLMHLMTKSAQLNAEREQYLKQMRQLS